MQGFQIGGIHIPPTAVLAPMAGVTDWPFRLLCRKFGCLLTYTEMVSAKGYLMNPSHAESLLIAPPGDAPLALQLFGAEPEVVGEAAQRLADAPFAFVDLNMGCPAPKITGNGEGSALMRDISLAARVIEATVRKAKKPVTVKFRKGWDGSSVNAVAFARMAEQSGAAAIAVHGRTREQQYSGQADWEIITEVKAAVGIPVMGNGDVDGVETAKKRMAQTGCDAVMIGRAALGNPWIFSGFDGGEPVVPTAQMRIETALSHLKTMMEWKGEQRAVLEMRKHIAWYIKGLPGAAALRERINHLGDYQQIEKVLFSYMQGEDDPA